MAAPALLVVVLLSQKNNAVAGKMGNKQAAALVASQLSPDTAAKTSCPSVAKSSVCFDRFVAAEKANSLCFMEI